jgi:DNA-binding NtrC family response regulator
MTEAKPRVLVVDDEESMRFFLRRALARRGFDVEAAPDGESGLKSFLADRPAAVLLDVRLPGMGGREVLERMRSADATVPVVIMTGYATVDDAMGAMWSGATDYVRKPLRADDVAAALERALASRGRAAPSSAATVRALAAPGAAQAPAASPAPPPAPGRAPVDPAAWAEEEARARGLGPLPPSGEGELHDAVRRFERVLVDEYLRRSRGNVARAARVAGLTRPNLHRKTKSLGLDTRRYRRPAGEDDR